MFTLNHLIWVAISVLIIIISLILLKKYKVSLEQMLSVSCFGGIISEMVKTFCVIKMVPLDDGSAFTPYIEMTDVPLHLCSFQIILIFLTKFTKNKKLKQLLLGFMYPTCSIGAFLAILLPSIFTDYIDPKNAFITPHVYQYFLYHSLLIVLGLYIYISNEAELKPKNYFTTIVMLLAFAFISFYLNSIFATPIYENGTLVSVQHMPNFFFTFLTPISIPLFKIWHWYIYFSIIVSIAVLLIGLFYLPVFIKAKKQKQQNNNPEKEKAFSR